MAEPDHASLPDGWPVPVDDGAAEHLTGLVLPEVVLRATDDSLVSLARLPGRTIVFAYPRTAARPAQPRAGPGCDTRCAGLHAPGLRFPVTRMTR